MERGEVEGLTDEEEARLDAVQAEITAIEEATARYSDETKAAGRAFVFLSDGGLRVVRGLPRAGQTTPQTADEMGTAEDDEEHGTDDQLSTPDHPAIKKPELSAALTAELTGGPHRGSASPGRANA